MKAYKKIDLRFNTPGERLKHLRALLGASRLFLQEKHKLPEATLKSWENGVKELTLAGAKRCAEAYRSEGLIVTESWILEGAGLSPASADAMNQYFSSTNQEECLDYQDDEICMIRDAHLFEKSYTNAIIMMVSSNEMSPVYTPGDYIGGKLRYGEDVDMAINKNCIVRLKNGDLIFRRLIKNQKKGYNLVCLNPSEITEEPVLFQVEIEAAAPVIWHRQKDS